MGDDLSLDERNSVRTPMQWSDEKNGGFSPASEEALIRPVIKDGPYGYKQVNVTRQKRDLDSLLNWIERLIRTRKEHPEFGFGRWRIIETGDSAVFAHACQWQESTILAIHNLSAEPRTVTLDLSCYAANQLIELLGDKEYKSVVKGTSRIELEDYGFRWFRLKSE